jgi:hypothetical protein
VFEAVHSERSSASPVAVWALWADPARWPEWNEQLEAAELRGPLKPGTEAVIKYKRGGRMVLKLVAVEPERHLAYEARLPLARFGHEHRLEPAGSGSEITHRAYLKGPLSPLFSVLFGRKRVRESVRKFAARERELAE